MTKIDLINRALLKLGEPPIASLTDEAFGKSYDLIYRDVKVLLLSSYPWRFAVARKKIPCCEERFGTKYCYKLPTDCLLLLSVFGSGEKARPTVGYEVAEDCIVTAVKNHIEIEYVKNIGDDGSLPPLFAEALVTKIAAEYCMRIKHSVSFKQMLENEFFYLIRQAELTNEIIKDTELIPDNSWVLVREVWN